MKQDIPVCDYCGSYKVEESCNACYNNKESLMQFEEED